MASCIFVEGARGLGHAWQDESRMRAQHGTRELPQFYGTSTLDVVLLFLEYIDTWI